MAAGRALAGALDRAQLGPDQPRLDAGRHRGREGRVSRTATTTRCSPSRRTSPRRSSPRAATSRSRASCTLVSNGAASTTVPYISHAIASAAATSLGTQATQGYLGQVYDGFNQIASSNQKAASSAGAARRGDQPGLRGGQEPRRGRRQPRQGTRPARRRRGAAPGRHRLARLRRRRPRAGRARSRRRGPGSSTRVPRSWRGAPAPSPARTPTLARKSRELARGAVATSAGAHRPRARARA